jgi:hypothetical protein
MLNSFVIKCKQLNGIADQTMDYAGRKPLA